jgi:glycosyltransferase involved in cell wall biosynthesis
VSAAVPPRPISPRSILHVLAPAPAGGLEQVVRALAVGQAARGHRVTVAAVLDEPGPGPDPEPAAEHPFVQSLTGTGVSVVRLTVGRRAYGRERALVRAVCARCAVEIVHTHGYRADVVDAGVARAARCAVVTTVHGFTGGGWRNRLYERLQRRAFRRFDAVVAVSAPLGVGLVRSGVPERVVHVIPNAYDRVAPVLPREAARAVLGLPEDAYVIGWVGRLSREKGLDVLLAALEQLGDRPAIVAVIGTGRERAALEAAAVARGLGPAVRWLGLVPQAGRVYRAFDVFVLSSRTEGTPIALFEAMDAGVPVVATAVGGVPAVVSAAQALLVPSEDPAALARALREVRDAPVASRERAAAASARLAAAYGVEPWLDRYEHLYAALSAAPLGTAKPPGRASMVGGKP